MQNRKKALFYISVILFSWVIVAIGSASWKRQPCRDVVTRIRNSENNMFLNPQGIEAEIRRVQGGDVRQQTMGDINVGRIEEALERNAFVERAEVAKDITCKLMVDVELRKPFARVFNIDGTSFYVDRNFIKMKTTPAWAPNVILVRGFILEAVEEGDTMRSMEMNLLKPMLTYLAKDEFLSAFVSEILIDERGEVSLRPVIGNELVEIGKPVDLDEKFSNLMLFYKQVLAKSDWYKYKKVSVKWKGQVVAS